MAAGFLRNAVKRQYSGDHLCRIHLIADSIKAPVIRNQFPRQQQQQPSKAFSRFPNFIYRKAKELEFLVPSSILSSPFSSTASSVTKIGVVVWYLKMIKSRPILTKSITSALIYTVADFSSQVGSFFVRQYYQVLQQQPDCAYQFYTDASTMIRVDGELNDTASALLMCATMRWRLAITLIQCI